jgi:hypothetical protein
MKSVNNFRELYSPAKSYQIEKNHGPVASTSTGRPQRHHYTVSVRMKPVQKELRPRAITELAGPGQTGTGLVYRKHWGCAA